MIWIRYFVVMTSGQLKMVAFFALFLKTRNATGNSGSIGIFLKKIGNKTIMESPGYRVGLIVGKTPQLSALEPEEIWDG